MSRRGLLAAGAATIVGTGLAGCADLPAALRGTPAPAGAGSGADSGADSGVVGQAAIALTAALSLLDRTERRHPGLRQDLAPVRALHAAHRDVLRPTTPTPSTTPGPTSAQTSGPTSGPTSGAVPVPARPRAALATVADAERALQARLTGLAQDATSGELARLLGAMAAATAQRSAIGALGALGALAPSAGAHS